MAGWSEYQDQVAELFRSIGLSATANERLQGVRTAHNVDVLVRSRHAGIPMIWIVECKAWRTRIPKEKVFALRSIVDDCGADRGILMAERGFQSGALQASRSTNVLLTSLAEMTEILEFEIGMTRLRALPARIDSCRDRYWDIPKGERIERGLRPQVGSDGYSGDLIIRAVEHTLHRAIFRGFPVYYDRMMSALSAFGDSRDVIKPDSMPIESPSQLFEILNAEIPELESHLGLTEP